MTAVLLTGWPANLYLLYLAVVCIVPVVIAVDELFDTVSDFLERRRDLLARMMAGPPPPCSPVEPPPGEDL